MHEWLCFKYCKMFYISSYGTSDFVVDSCIRKLEVNYNFFKSELSLEYIILVLGSSGIILKRKKRSRYWLKVEM